MKRCNLKTFCKKIAINKKSYFFYFSQTLFGHPYCTQPLICLRTLIPLDETIDSYINCCNPETLLNGISKHILHNLLNLTTKESFFTFNDKFYIQADGVTLGFCLASGCLLNTKKQISALRMRNLIYFYFYMSKSANEIPIKMPQSNNCEYKC